MPSWTKIWGFVVVVVLFWSSPPSGVTPRTSPRPLIDATNQKGGPTHANQTSHYCAVQQHTFNATYIITSNAMQSLIYRHTIIKWQLFIVVVVVTGPQRPPTSKKPRNVVTWPFYSWVDWIVFPNTVVVTDLCAFIYYYFTIFTVCVVAPLSSFTWTQTWQSPHWMQ